MYKQFLVQQKAADCHGDGLITESKDKIWMVGLVYTIFAMTWLIWHSCVRDFFLSHWLYDINLAWTIMGMKEFCKLFTPQTVLRQFPCQIERELYLLKGNANLNNCFIYLGIINAKLNTHINYLVVGTTQSSIYFFLLWCASLIGPITKKELNRPKVDTL